MNQTEKILNDIKEELKLKNTSQLARHFNLSRTIIYMFINNDAISLKFYKLAKAEDLQTIKNISNEYIMNNILKV